MESEGIIKKKKIIVAIIIIIAVLTGLYIITRNKGNNKGNIIYYESFVLLTSHAPMHAGKYIIYDAGVIEEYFEEGNSSLEEPISSKKITKQELKELKNLIEKVSKTSKPKQDSQPKVNFAGVVSASGRYIYNNKNQKILLDNIESAELHSLETFVENLKKKYCK